MSLIHLRGRTQSKSIHAVSFLIAVYSSLQGAQKLSKAFLQLSGKHQGAAQVQKSAIAPTKLRNKHRNFNLKTGVKKQWSENFKYLS